MLVEMLKPGLINNSNKRWRVLNLGRLILRSQAPGAQVKVLCLAININSRRMNIGHPAAVGVTLGVADIMTELRCFPA
jgi:hypothetical protein